MLAEKVIKLGEQCIVVTLVVVARLVSITETTYQ
jgi:hypothetical protein